MILERINSPKDLKNLTLDELSKLCSEVRDLIISVVSENGGHLAPSLGVVELTIALHYVFNTPSDVIIWDVGHQSYAHKIITGRRESFKTLRKFGGISGFPKRSESIYDAFDVGHSGTSISAALGVAKAKRFCGSNEKVIAVIGDGSICSGIAFEAMNQAANIDADLIVVLNDNEMSIAKNVGALSSYLSKIMTGQTVDKLRVEIKKFLQSIPAFGDYFLKRARQIEESIKVLFSPGLLFEELGFKYVGPYDGHDLKLLIDGFRNVARLHTERPILVHVVTKKGKGYKPAEENPTKFHGIGPFFVETGEPKNRDEKKSYTEVFGETICELARENEKIVAITAGMRDGTGLLPFSKEFPDRFFDVGISEQHAVTFAAGLSTQGFIPVVAIYSTFLQRAYDQIIMDVCLQNLHVVFAIDRAGIVGEDGPTHHGAFDLSYLRPIPNIVIMAPKDEWELKDMLKFSTELKRPVAIRYPRGRGVGFRISPHKEINFSKSQILKEGQDVAIFAVGSMVYPSLCASKILESWGVSCSVINARFIKPIDEEMIFYFAKNLKNIVVVEENTISCGFGSAVCESLSKLGLSNVRVKLIGIPDSFIEHGSRDLLIKKVSLDRDSIAKSIKEFLEG